MGSACRHATGGDAAAPAVASNAAECGMHKEKLQDVQISIISFHSKAEQCVSDIYGMCAYQ